MFGFRKKRVKVAPVINMPNPSNLLVKAISNPGKVTYINGVPIGYKPAPATPIVKKVKAIKKRTRVCTRVCLWCNGSGRDAVFFGQLCSICKGQGGDFEYRMITTEVHEESII